MVTVVLMVACGIAAMALTLYVLMSLGLKYHNNYEYYGQTPANLLIPISGLIAFVLPGIIVWRLHQNHWRVSLRTLLIAVTVTCVLLGALVYAVR